MQESRHLVWPQYQQFKTTHTPRKCNRFKSPSFPQSTRPSFHPSPLLLLMEGLPLCLWSTKHPQYGIQWPGFELPFTTEQPLAKCNGRQLQNCREEGKILHLCIPAWLTPYHSNYNLLEKHTRSQTAPHLCHGLSILSLLAAPRAH